MRFEIQDEDPAVQDLEDLVNGPDVGRPPRARVYEEEKSESNEQDKS